MPPIGYKTITVKEELYDEVKAKAISQNVKVSQKASDYLIRGIENEVLAE